MTQLALNAHRWITAGVFLLLFLCTDTWHDFLVGTAYYLIGTGVLIWLHTLKRV